MAKESAGLTADLFMTLLYQTTTEMLDNLDAGDVADYRESGYPSADAPEWDGTVGNGRPDGSARTEASTGRRRGRRARRRRRRRREDRENCRPAGEVRPGGELARSADLRRHSDALVLGGLGLWETPHEWLLATTFSRPQPSGQGERTSDVSGQSDSEELRQLIAMCLQIQ